MFEYNATLDRLIDGVSFFSDKLGELSREDM